MKDWMNLDSQYLLPTYGRMPVVVQEAKGMLITDEAGDEYLDLFSGLAVNVLGHSHPALVKELRNQGEKFLHISNFFYNKPAIALAEKLIQSTFPGKIFFTNSGAESTEAAIKYIHKYGQDQNKKGIVVFKNSFHGRTLGALKLTRMSSVQQDFPMMDFPVYEIEGEDLQALEKVLSEYNPAAFLFEPVTGSGGINVVSEAFIEGAHRLCKQYNSLFCLDEIQTGVGRTGKLFAYQYTDIQPDILLFAKGIGGGLPLGGMIVAKEIDHYFRPGDHGTTFAPNPLSSALGLKTLEVLEAGLLEKVNEKFYYFINSLGTLREKYPHLLGEIRGKGMMIGIDLLQYGDRVKDLFLERKVLINITNGNVLRLLPPLIIEEEHIDRFIHTFEEILLQLEAHS